jgi:hypothetical protein
LRDAFGSGSSLYSLSVREPAYLIPCCLSLRVCSAFSLNTLLFCLHLFSLLSSSIFTRFHHTSVLQRDLDSNMGPLQLVRCASGSCFKDGTLQCAKCKVTFYCSKTCQKNHWISHKKHCSTHKPLPKGAFEFLKLNRDTRNKVGSFHGSLRL